MDPSVLGTGQLVLSRASSAPHRLPVRPPLPPGCADSGCTPLVGSSCVVQDVAVDPQNIFMVLRWAPPSGSPADLPLPFTYVSNATNSTELGFHWSGPYHRFAENITTINPNPVNVNTPLYSYSYSNNGTSYANVLPNQNTLVGNSTTGWTETQPDGTSFNFDNTGVLRTVRNRAGVRWTLTWDSGFNHVQGIQAPFGRRTTFVYNGSNLITPHRGPGGPDHHRDGQCQHRPLANHQPRALHHNFRLQRLAQLCAWVNPLGDRTSFIYQSGSVFAVQQPLGQRSTYTSRAGGFFPPSPATTTFTNPRNAAHDNPVPVHAGPRRRDH